MLRLRRVLMLVLLALVIGYAAIVLLAYGAQRSLLYPAPSPQRVEERPGLTSVTLEGAPPVYFLHVPAPEGAPTLAYFHGNGEQLSSALWLATEARRSGLGFLAIEYPGYGPASDQVPSEQAIYDAAHRALTAAVETHGVRRERLVLLGFSLGGGVATEMASRGWGERLVLVAPFTSLPEVASRHFPFLPVRLLLRDRYDNLAKAPGIRMPVLVVHGETDEVISADFGRRLSHAFHDARFVGLPRSQHGGALSDALERVLAFASGEG